MIEDVDLSADLPLTPEFNLLLACGPSGTAQDKQAVCAALLTAELDWTNFCERAVEHGVIGLAAQTLSRLVPGQIPAEILSAFQSIEDAATQAGAVMFDELVRVTTALSGRGVDAICFKGPILALQAYGDIASREFSDLDLLVRDEHLAVTIATLKELGYPRAGDLTTTQFDLIHRLQGQEIIFGEETGMAIEPHTRLTSLKFALAIDYPSLWRRAVRSDINGCTFQTFAPEDDLLVLAIHGGKEIWRKLKWAYDIAAFIGSHPGLDWGVVVARARAQGCLRMLVLATALARRYLGAVVPATIIAAERADRLIDPMVRQIVERWQFGGQTESPSNKSISLDRMRLHDGPLKQAEYAVRTLFLPGPHHVASFALPRHLAFGYIPYKLGHDLVALPFWKTGQTLLAAMAGLPYACAGSRLALFLIPAPSTMKQEVRRYQFARLTAERALARNQNDLAAWRDLGDALSGLRRFKAAVACYDRALFLEPGHMATMRKRTAARESSGMPNLHPTDPPEQEQGDARDWIARAQRMFSLGDYLESIEASDRALALEPGNADALRVGIQGRLQLCDWRQRDADMARILDDLQAKRPLISRLQHRSVAMSEARNAQFALVSYPAAIRTIAPLWQGETYHHDRIRIAYVLPDLRLSPAAATLAACLVHHDRSRFDVTAVALAPTDVNVLRERLTNTSDHLLIADAMADESVARSLRDREADIVVTVTNDMMDCRLRITAHRPAPLQVNWPDHGGTSGLPFLDYIIADRTIIPDSDRNHYAEQIVYLPHACVPPNRRDPAEDATLGRLELGLPASGFVFLCQEAGHKITPEMFETWMRVLKSVDGSVLWFGAVPPAAMNNLRREAASRGVAPERLVIAKPMAQAEERLARLRRADLVLDTRPQNGSLAVYDALALGIPVLTCPGSSAAGRIAASLLLAMNMPELVARSLSDYETIATELACDPHRLAAVKAKLMRNSMNEPPFDNRRFTRDLEAAFTQMCSRQKEGLQPTGFSVERDL